MFDSCYAPFKLHYADSENLAIGDFIQSEVISSGGHLWRMICYPRGDPRHNKDNKAADYLSIYLALMSNARGVKAIFEAFVIEKNGEPSTLDADRFMHLFREDSNIRGCPRLVKRSDLESLYVVDGWVTIVWGVIVVRDDTLSVPPSNIGSHLGRLLDCAADGSDISFVIGGETFPAHRAVLAARSPVFKAELFGSMAEASMSHITLEDIRPATFRVFLRFIYTDALPEDDDSTIEMYKHLLAVADRYAMDRLKLMCAKKLWDDVSVDTVAETLSYAETYSCAELKSKCIAFFIDEENFMDAALTNGYASLVHKFPEIIDELKKKATSLQKRKKAKN